jgi:dTDP-4-dehydrorhamnose 3,5-epimerase
VIAVLPYRIIPGGIHRDSRGTLQHANAFGFEKVDRFYTIIPSKPHVVRGWVGHCRDWKWFFALRGSFDLGVVQPKDWAHPMREEKVESIRLSAEVSRVLEVPPGHFTACRSLEADAMLLVFSSGVIDQSVTDDFRLPVDYWTLPDGVT